MHAANGSPAYVLWASLCASDCDVNGFFEEVKSTLRAAIDATVFIGRDFLKY